MIVGGQLLVELKAVEAIQTVHRAQVATYLRLLQAPLGLLINFNVPLIKDGTHRILNPEYKGANDQNSDSASSLSKKSFAPSR
jgi:hypothetical protein